MNATVEKILVSGLINIETTLRVDSFPVNYNPVRYPFFGVNTTVSGVGYNIAKALTTLGDAVQLVSLIGQDPAGKLVREALEETGIRQDLVVDQLAHTAQSVILYEQSGRRQIHVDLKDIQEQTYPVDRLEQALRGCSLAVLCNINFSRPFLRLARQAGKPIASDVHAISSFDDDYNRDFMQAADILFMSDEQLPLPPEQWIRNLWNRYAAEIVVVSRGAKGALLGLRSSGSLEHLPAVYARPVVNTIGAGDALFSSFIHGYLRSGNAYTALRKAMVFAAYKIGEKGAAEGFLDETSLDELSRQVHSGVA